MKFLKYWKSIEKPGGGYLGITFFIQGNRIRTLSAVKTIKRMKKAGYEIGNHSWSHARLSELSTWKIQWELWKTDFVLFLLGIKAMGVRTPYGEQTEDIEKVLRKRHSDITENILWTIHSKDSNGATAEEILQVLKGAKDGDIILCHAWSKETAKALEQFLYECGTEIEFVTVSEIMRS